MRVMTWNARHGGGRRARDFAERIVAYDPDAVVITEFRNNESGNLIRSILSANGLSYQSTTDTAPRLNSVLVAAASEFREEQVPGLGAAAYRGVIAKFPTFDLLGFYFPGMKEKLPIFEAICALDLSQLNCASVIMGDLNTGKHFIDERQATFVAAEYFDQLEELGWIDVWRSRNPKTTEFTWFSNVGNGFRLDHAFATHDFNRTVTEVKYLHDVREEGISDHSAMILESVLA